MTQTTTINDALVRLSSNENRFDIFTNDPLDIGHYTTNETSPRNVPTLPKLVTDWQNSYFATVSKGAWVTATLYSIRDLVTQTGVVYQCVATHTSGTFATDLAAAKWAVYQGLTTDTGVQIVNNITTLRAIPPSDRYIDIRYHTNTISGGGGRFRGVTGATAGTYVHDDGCIIVPIGGDGSSAWVRLVSSDIRASYYGCDSSGVTDSSSSANAAFAYLKNNGGGVLYFDEGNYSLNIDISGVNPAIKMVGVGNVKFIPYQISPSKDYVIRANNNTSFGIAMGTNFIFNNITVSGRKLGSVNNGDIATPVSFVGASAKFYDCNFEYGVGAAFYGKYAQYNEFYSCTFGASISGASSSGCILDSNTDAEASNECIFLRCKFLTTKNGLVIKGGIGNRVTSCQFQNTVSGGVGALVLDADATGFASTANVVRDCYFEDNSRDVYIGVSSSSNFVENVFLAGSIYTTHCYENKFVGNKFYTTPSIVFNHPAGNTDTASLEWIGNNAIPSVNGLAHAGDTYLNILSSGLNLEYERQDSILRTCGQVAANSNIPLVFSNFAGSKSGIPRTVVTNIFSVKQKTFASLPARYSSFDLLLHCVNDDVSTAITSYASRRDLFHVFISNNTSGTPQVFISAVSGGTDIGLSTGFAAIGAITLSYAIVGDLITFKIAYSGAGSSPTTLTSITCNYSINYTGANPVYFERL